MDNMQLEFTLRIFVAAILGGLIGLEREYRSKEAGFRTHFLVALGSALFMIVSAYGFSDVPMSEAHRWDVSRIAAQVVSGIGFIGAGTIIFHKSENIVRGLTTAQPVHYWFCWDWKHSTTSCTCLTSTGSSLSIFILCNTMLHQ